MIDISQIGNEQPFPEPPLTAIYKEAGILSLDSDEPLVCPMNKEDGQICEACQ